MRIIPKPLKYMKFFGQFVFDADTKIYYCEQFENSARFFAEFVYKRTGVLPKFVEQLADAQIKFCFSDNTSMSADRYCIHISDGCICVNAISDLSAFYAAQSLIQLFELDVATELPVCCDNCFVADSPKYNYRGLHLDIARHFFGAEEIKTVLELMSRVKLNKLHLHISNDQGFRIQIDKYPKINQISSYRDGSERRTGGKTFVDEEKHGGFLTKDQVRDIVNYAASLHIDVIPELDLPGHTTALIAAYPELSCVGTEILVRKRWGISKDIMCAGNDAVYRFVTDILDELCQLFPSESFHLGGDEAPKDRWCNCDKCLEKISELKLSGPEELQTHMFNYFAEYLKSKGKRAVVWNDGVTAGTDKYAQVQYWIRKPTARQLIAEERNVILSPFYRMYFDYPYAMTPVKKTYKLRPQSIGSRSKNKEHMIGVEGTLWTEHIACSDKLFFNLLPRMLALAECAWGTNNSYGDFKKRAKQYFAVYEDWNLCFNRNALGHIAPHKRIKAVRKFFTQDANAEFNETSAIDKEHSK
ncbi:MAG: beta-N-acetylhexosaminidase [Corallococcus sp.]|nr:beta-N-acetylhexosaminidase [Corallococcus sp.]